ncbi:alpha-galactosidase [Puniceibacterium sediminis]|uniref:alpha-galactosidase n=1 Tax=Puniceibacterium sediminis TaxID=1608407 RepID=A0A238UZZ0_9RHOB|nr:alpha-galactosidase [Puniceibacterium sediminis]
MQVWRLDDGRQTLVLSARAGEMAEVVYWGLALPADEDLKALAAMAVQDVTGGMIDALPPLSLCPEAGRSFPGQPGLVLRSAQGALLSTRLVFERAEVAAGRLTLWHRDAGLGLRYGAHFEPCRDSHVIRAWAELMADQHVRLDWLAAPVLPAPQDGGMVDVSGRWIGEFRLNKVGWRPGVHLRESRLGRTDHAHFPGLLLTGAGATNTAGRVHGLHYGWSGGHRMLAEELPDGRRQVQFGHAQGTELEPAQRFETAVLFLTVSDSGLSGVGTAFQRHLRDRVVTWPMPDAPRRVHYNCWEAVYFDHNLETLKDIASRAADLGAERFVLDDGWFGRRDDDTTSLGDWGIDPRKWPDGFAPFIEHLTALGMSFGLWFEPEMVNLKSDLARAHPDWVLGPEDQIEGRQQRVLDMSRSEVRDYLYARIAAVLGRYPIDYIKWDHNRVLPMPDARQARGTYALMDRLRADFPAVEIESCASGGGRIDFGIMQRCSRIWLSDSNDALERARIQHDAALFLPAAVTGSHVGPRRCHTSGRVIDIRFRAWVAAQRQMGFEMDPRELTTEEAGVLQQVTQWWKDNRDWRMAADILRLDSTDPAVLAEMQLARDAARFVVFAAQMGASDQIVPRPLRLTGLERDARYDITLVNRAEAVGLSRGVPLLKSADVTLSGAYLMQHGLTLPWCFPQTMWVVEGKRA